MPFTPINLANLQPIKPYVSPGSPYEDMFSKMLQGYEMSQKPGQMARKKEEEILANKLKGEEVKYAPDYFKGRAAGQVEGAEETRLKNALTKEFGREEKISEINYKKAQALEKSVLSGESAKERRIKFNALGPDAKADMYRRGGILNMSPEDVQQMFIEGRTFDQEAISRGINPNIFKQEVGNVLPTSSVRSDITRAESAAAELETLEKETSKDLSRYGATFGGYSPGQIADAVTGKNKKEMIDFLGARALQPEIAGIRSRIAQGSNAHEALKGAQEAALANFKIPGFTITPEIREGVQKYINERLKSAFKSRKKSVFGKKDQDQVLGSMIENPKLESISEEELEKIAGGR